MRPVLVVLSALLLVLVGGAALASPSSERAAVGLVEVASGFESPVHVAAAPGEPDRLYVVEQAGRIRVVVGGRVRPEPFLDVVDLVESRGNEQGLLSVAFHPSYATNRKLYVNYTSRAGGGDTRVVEYRSDGERVLERTARELLRVDQPYSNHNGGQLAFGPDGRLYVGMGDGGSGGDPENRAQDLRSRLGKLLRLNVDRRDAAWHTVAYGLRNPWRFSFDRSTGDLYIGDVGQVSFEEVDYTPRRSPGLENYGWDVFEGRARFEDKPLNPKGKLVQPIVAYPRSGGCSVIGGFVYRGARVPAAVGRYFYGDYCTGILWSLRVSGGKAKDVRREPFTVPELTSFGEALDGELYLASRQGTVYRLSDR